ncbi:MAG: hypothetical protein HQM06_16600 [Magnetococcales bacterium]|nr:hypothetical protein [Magnetococcales bacterium]
MPDLDPNQTVTLTLAQLDEMTRARSKSASWLGTTARYVGARLTEPSTYAGVALAATALGAHIDPEKFQALSQVGTMLAGLIFAASKDTGSPA